MKCIDHYAGIVLKTETFLMLQNECYSDSGDLIAQMDVIYIFKLDSEVLIL